MPKGKKGFQKGNTHGFEKGVTSWNKGKHHSKKTRKKISKSRNGQKSYERTEQFRKKISESRKGKKLSEETKRKMSKAMKGKTGKDSRNWKGGITPIYYQIRNCLKYRQWRLDVFARDDFTCHNCGDNKGGNLEAHHIKEFAIIIKEYNIKTLKEALDCEELWNINNGMTLCKKCHKLSSTLIKNKIKNN